MSIPTMEISVEVPQKSKDTSTIRPRVLVSYSCGDKQKCLFWRTVPEEESPPWQGRPLQQLELEADGSHFTCSPEAERENRRQSHTIDPPPVLYFLHQGSASWRFLILKIPHPEGFLILKVPHPEGPHAEGTASWRFRNLASQLGTKCSNLWAYV